jgi:hypothetical protein
MRLLFREPFGERRVRNGPQACPFPNSVTLNGSRFALIRSHCTAVLPHLSVEACSGSDAKEIRGAGVSRWAVPGLRPDKVLSSQHTCGSDHLLRVRAGGGGVRIGTINGLGAELPKRDAVVFTGPPCCLTAPSDRCGEGNSPLGGAFVPRRRAVWVSGTTR